MILLVVVGERSLGLVFFFVEVELCILPLLEDELDLLPVGPKDVETVDDELDLADEEPEEE